MTFRERWARMTSGVPPFEGPDKRVNRKLAAFFEWMLLFWSNVPPAFLHFEFLGFRAGIPWPMKRLSTGWGTFHARAHILRWDAYHHGYISFSAMAKRVDPREVAP